MAVDEVTGTSSEFVNGWEKRKADNDSSTDEMSDLDAKRARKDENTEEHMTPIFNIPPELIPLIASCLPSNDVNSLSATCKHLKNCIEADIKQSYTNKRRIRLIMRTLGQQYNMVWHHKFGRVTLVGRKQEDRQLLFSHAVTMPRGTPADQNIYDEWVANVCAEFDKMTLQACLDAILGRIGGFVELDLGEGTDKFNEESLASIRPLLQRCDKLKLNCILSEVPLEQQIDWLCNHKGPLDIFYQKQRSFPNIPVLTNDRFWSEAGSGRMYIRGREEIPLTDAQLLMIANRTDLSIFRCTSKCRGLTLNGIRAVIQVLLRSELDFAMAWIVVTCTTHQFYNMMDGSLGNEIVKKDTDRGYVYISTLNGHAQVVMNFKDFPSCMSDFSFTLFVNRSPRD